jgi:hypothetical protein
VGTIRRLIAAQTKAARHLTKSSAVSIHTTSSQHNTLRSTSNNIFVPLHLTFPHGYFPEYYTRTFCMLYFIHLSYMSIPSETSGFNSLNLGQYGHSGEKNRCSLSDIEPRTDMAMPTADLCLLPASCWLVACLMLRPRRWRGHVPPKRRLTSNGLHGVISRRYYYCYLICFVHVILYFAIFQNFG